ncbi:uncharacterized protein LOC128209694 [Mya arenaria]|uniref:uncharacterized protein LOC128209694 n=1 Tax=Mya arenaria TaxID=6604 RepID=UPI0022E444DA|nr:uncharacterized protein LOC128209694 [Mya arenaria]
MGTRHAHELNFLARVIVSALSRAMPEASKKDFFLCSSLAAACLFYAFLDFSPTSQPVTLAPAKPDSRSITDTPRTLLCHASGFSATDAWRHKPHIFVGHLQNETTVFLSNNQAINADMFKTIDIGTCSAHFIRGAYFHCCSYTPYIKQQDKRDFTFLKEDVFDPFIRLDGLIYGKPKLVDITVSMQMDTRCGKINVTALHRRRIDVSFDQYPEIHIVVENGSNNWNFHWYL